MYLKSIFFGNFRNYKNLDLNFSNRINIIYGDNGQGKTNLLEGIYFLSFTKSHRTNTDYNMIKDGETISKVKGMMFENDISKKLEIVLSKDNKKYIVDDEIKKHTYDYISNLNSIIFTPDDLNLIKGSPNDRRHYLNIEISQLNKAYYKLINEYAKILKMRNDYLKGNSFNSTYYDIITEHFIDKASYIIYFRYKYIKKINKYVGNIYKDIMEVDNFLVSYETCVDNFDSVDEIRNSLYKKYNSLKQSEIINKITLFGPHKDDIQFLLNSNNLKVYGSQGQQRCAILSFKLAEIDIIEEVNGIKPILLLDDVFSELDDTKKNNLLKYFDNDIQVIITTTDINNIDENIVKNAKLIEIKNAEIISEVK